MKSITYIIYNYICCVSASAQRSPVACMCECDVATHNIRQKAYKLKGLYITPLHVCSAANLRIYNSIQCIKYVYTYTVYKLQSKFLGPIICSSIPAAFMYR